MAQSKMGRSTGRLTISARKQAAVDVVKVVVYARRSISNKTPQNLQILPKLHQKSLVVYSSSEILQLFVKSSSRLLKLLSSAPSPMPLAARAERDSRRRLSTAAFLLRHALIFDSNLTVHQSSIWRLPSASLEALQPSSAGLKSVQTSSASAMQQCHM